MYDDPGTYRRIAASDPELLVPASKRSCAEAFGETGFGPSTDLERSLLVALARVAEFRIDPSGRHAARVGRLAAELSRVMDMGDPFSEMICWAAPLHDIGTVGVPDRVLLSPEALGPQDASTMQLHTSLGEVIFGEDGPGLLQMARRIAVSHHERWDGSGYPRALRGTAIPIEARIVAVADTYESLTHGLSHGEALQEVVAESGRAFDPRVVEALVRIRDRAAA